MILLPVIILFSLSANAQESILGIWETADAKTGKPQAHVKIFEKNGLVSGRIIRYLPDANLFVCAVCPEDIQGKPLTEVDLLWGLKPHKDYWSYGRILDPRKGNTYKLNAKREGNLLKLRGYIGFSLIGKTQIWRWVSKD